MACTCSSPPLLHTSLRLYHCRGAKSPSYCMELHVGHPPRLLRVVFAQSPDATLVVTAAWREEAGP